MGSRTAIRIATQEALKVTRHRHRHGAVVMRGGNVLSRAGNDGVHAEIRAALKLRAEERTGADIWVVRVPHRDEKSLAMSRPCRKCQLQLRALSIGRVFFSNETGIIDVWKP